MNIRIGMFSYSVSLRPADIFIVREVLHQKPYITEDILSHPPRCIVDLGAHIGLATLLFKAYFPDAVVHSYEPDPDNFALLQENTVGLDGIILHQEAVGTERAEANLYIPDNRHTASSLLRPRAQIVREVGVRVKPLDDVIAHAGCSVELVKFDIEGVEFEVFAVSRFIHQVPWIIGEIKAEPSKVGRFIRLFSDTHVAKVVREMPRLHYVFLSQKISRLVR